MRIDAGRRAAVVVGAVDEVQGYTKFDLVY